jgi:hypothetical protein
VRWGCLSFINEIGAYGRFAVGLRRYLKEPATAECGRKLIRQRLHDRDMNFLTLMKRAVYERGGGPYLALLRMAGCEYGDLERMVRSEGIESTLRGLRDAGVYLTIDEFKCRKDVVRGSAAVHCRPRDFDNPFLARSITTGSSGSRGPSTTTTVNLERSRHNALCLAVAFSAHRISGKPTVLWMPILPSAAGLGMLLQSSKMGVPPRRWFSPVAQRTIRPVLSKRLATLYVVYAGRLFGADMPAPEYVSGEQTQVVADCLNEVLKLGQGCVVFSSPSSAARVCQLAGARHLDFSGVTFRVGGEPLTAAKDAEIRSVGAAVLSSYAFAEGGLVGHSCAGQKRVCDDVHLLAGSLAVIQHRRDMAFGGSSVDAFLFTTLFDKAPKILLNVENGDCGVLETRDCDCELGALGLTTHLHAIRSFEKLTGEGVSFVGTDLVRIIEEVLPARFGGASTDYQMVEVEDAGGLTRLDVLVSPGVGIVVAEEVVDLVLSELRKGSDTNRMMAEVWRERGMLQVRREQPRLTPGGKLLPLHYLKQTEG